jgi:hypothetical protein
MHVVESCIENAHSLGLSGKQMDYENSSGDNVRHSLVTHYSLTIFRPSSAWVH